MDRFSIKDIEALTGIKAANLRMWETRYNLVEPKRSTTNIRYYDQDDLRKLLGVAALMRQGAKISHLAKMQAEDMFRDFPLPPGVGLKFTGQHEHEEESKTFLSKAFLVAIFLIFLILVTMFNSIAQPLIIALLAVPILVQTLMIAALGYWLCRKLEVQHDIAGPAAMIGASNFFELAVAVAIVLYGFNSGAALATVVGVLIEVPVMLMLVRICLKTQRWFGAEQINTD